MHNIVEVNTFTANVPTCDDGDPGAAATFNPTDQALANRTNNLNSRVTTLEGANLATRVSALESEIVDTRVAKAFGLIQVAPGGSAVSLLSSRNISGTPTIQGAGPWYFQIFFATPFASANYTAVPVGWFNSTSGPVFFNIIRQAANELRLVTVNSSGTTLDPIGGNSVDVHFACYGA